MCSEKLKEAKKKSTRYTINEKHVCICFNLATCVCESVYYKMVSVSKKNQMAGGEDTRNDFHLIF